MPPLLHDIVRDTLVNRTDMEVVGDWSQGPAVRGALKDADVDVVIIGARQPDDDALASQVFLEAPFSKVLVIATSGRTAVMYQLRPEKRLLGDVSPQSVIEAIRGDV
jgi:DNA-binding NarL/FixJ family response regulator